MRRNIAALPLPLERHGRPILGGSLKRQMISGVPPIANDGTTKVPPRSSAWVTTRTRSAVAMAVGTDRVLDLDLGGVPQHHREQ